MILMAGISQEDYEKLDEGDFEHLKNIYEDVVKVWNYLPEYVWENYAIHGITGLDEQRLLESTLSNLKKRVKQCLRSKKTSRESEN